jgi:hypothetical protein
MGQVTFKLEADEAKAVKAFMRVVDAQKKTERGAKKAGDAGKQAGKATEKGAKGATGAFDNMGKSAVNSFKAMATGLIGAGGVLAAVQMVRAELEATAAAQRDLANKAMTIDKAGVGGATQFGMGYTDAGHAKGREVLQKIAMAGKFGDDVGLAKGVTIAGHAAYGEKGEALSGKALDIAMTGARFAGYTQMDEESAAGYFKVLEQSGAKTQEDVLKRSAQFYEAYKGALSVDPGANIGGVVRFMAQHVERGGKVERGLARYSRAVNITGSEQEAAQMVRKVTDMLGKKEVAASLAAKAWPEMAAVDDVSEGLAGFLGLAGVEKRKRKKLAENKEIMVKRFMALPLGEREKMFGEFTAGADDYTLMNIGLESRQVGWARSMYSGGGLEKINELEAELKKTTPEGVLRELDSYDQTAYAKKEVIKTKTAMLAAQTSEATKRGDALLKLAEEKNKLMREGSMEDVFSEAGRFLRTEGREKYDIALKFLRGRVENLKGKVPEDQRILAYHGVVRELHGAQGWSMNPRDVGEIALLVEKLEDMVVAVKENTESNKKLNDTNKTSGDQQKFLTPGAITGDIHGE